MQGVNSLGFDTTVQPSTSDGAEFQKFNANGKFHGEITPTTPLGCRCTIISLSSISDAAILPIGVRPVAAATSTIWMASFTSAKLSFKFLPVSEEIILTNLSLFFSIK